MILYIFYMGYFHCAIFEFKKNSHKSTYVYGPKFFKALRADAKKIIYWIKVSGKQQTSMRVSAMALNPDYCLISPPGYRVVKDNFAVFNFKTSIAFRKP